MNKQTDTQTKNFNRIIIYRLAKKKKHRTENLEEHLLQGILTGG